MEFPTTIRVSVAVEYEETIENPDILIDPLADCTDDEEAFLEAAEDAAAEQFAEEFDIGESDEVTVTVEPVENGGGDGGGA